MYVNPFERMRKKREDEEKSKAEVEKEREKYARLSEQMGFTQEKGVIPSFIKSLIGDQNQVSKPPFAQFNDMNNQQNQASAAGFVPQQAPQMPVGQPQQAPQMLVGQPQQAPQMPVGQQQMQNFAQPTPSFVPQQAVPAQSFVPQQAPQVQNFAPQAPGFGKPQQPQSVNQAPIKPPVSPLNTMKAVSKEEEWVPTSFQNSQSTFTEEFYNGSESQTDLINTNQLNKGQKQMTPVEFVSSISTNSLDGNTFMVLDSPESDALLEIIQKDLPKNKQVEIDIKEAYQYNNPDLFLLKQIINKLPLISMEDKRFLWEKTSLCLSATQFGKTGGDIDQVIEEVGITNPVELIVKEFTEALSAYGLVQVATPIILKNFKNLEFSGITSVLQFINEIFNDISCFKFVFQIQPAKIAEAQKFELVKQLLANTSATIVAQVQNQETQSSTSTQDFFDIDSEFDLTDDLADINQSMAETQNDFDFDSFLNQNLTSTQEIIDQENTIDNFQFAQSESSQPEQQNSMWTSQGPGHEDHNPFIPDNAKYDLQGGLSNLGFKKVEDQTFFDKHHGFANKPDYDHRLDLEPAPQLIHQEPNFTQQSAPAPQPQQSFSQQPAFVQTSAPAQEQSFAPRTYDTKESLLQNNVRIRVDLNLQRQAEEIASREKNEETERLEKVMDVGFNPEILADDAQPQSNEFNLLNKFGSQSETFNPNFGRTAVASDPREDYEIINKLNQLNQELAQKSNINIQDNFAKQDPNNKNSNVISIPGTNWSNLK